METDALKFSIASSQIDFPYRLSKFRLSNLMSSQKASDIENILFGAFSRSINSDLQQCSDMSLPFFVTPTNLVLITGKNPWYFSSFQK